ncbi:unnamed protein product, partial [marine sediment metagenome]
LHPRKAHMMMWVQISPSDDAWVQLELVYSDPDIASMAKRVFELEEAHGFQVARRLIDPNMGMASASGRHREITWEEEFASCGLRCDLAENDKQGDGVGIDRVNTHLKPDRRTRDVRIHIHRDRCPTTVEQMLRYCWADYKKSAEKDQKQQTRDKYDDFPTLFRYLLNSNPEFSVLRTGSPIVSRRPANAEARKKGLVREGHRRTL